MMTLWPVSCENDRWPMIPFRGQRSGVKVTRSINAEMENVPYLGKGKAYKLQTWYTDGVRDSHHQYARWPQRSNINFITTRRQFDAWLAITRKTSHRSTKIKQKVVRATCEIARQFRGQKAKGQGHQTDEWSGWLFKSPHAGAMLF